ncbi:MAG: chemotaxis protein CheW [Deltaproteobacteria bacterium]|nr:chemotaxis protein CheW [Deltaproteobacteria bacterium]
MGAQDSNRHLVFRAGNAWAAVPVPAVLEIRALPEYTPLPGQPRFMRGLIVVDEKIVPVIELGEALGLEAEETESKVRRGRLVVLGQEKRRMGIHTSRVLGFVDLREEERAGVEVLAGPIAAIAEEAYMALDGWVAVSTFDKLFGHVRGLITR